MAATEDTYWLDDNFLPVELVLDRTGDFIRGLTYYDDKVFAAFSRTGLLVFNGTCPCNKLSRYACVGGMQSKTDVVSCNETSELFIALHRGNIWRMDVTSLERYERERAKRVRSGSFVEFIRPHNFGVGWASQGDETFNFFERYVHHAGGVRSTSWTHQDEESLNLFKHFVHHAGGVRTMSLTRRRLLITPASVHYYTDMVSVLCVHDAVDGSLLQSVPLPTSIRPSHAIESDSGFVVSHWGDSHDHLGVSEVNSDGHVIRTYGGPELVNEPDYLQFD